MIRTTTGEMAFTPSEFILVGCLEPDVTSGLTISAWDAAQATVSGEICHAAETGRPGLTGSLLEGW
jgi:hypothetical protein